MAGFSFSHGKTALITGGASGIGLAVAKKCVDNGMRVFVVDNNATLLNTVGKDLGEGVFVFEMDVGKAEDWVRLRETVTATFQGVLDFLFLNAGIQPASSWEDPTQFQTIMDVNFFGVVHGITHFLDLARTTPGSAIVITGSKQGITNPPGNPAYNASKSAVKTVAEQLSYDLRDTDTSMHLLVPGWTFTGLGRTNDEIKAEKPAAAWSASQVVDYLEAGISRGEFYILCPDNEVTEDMDKKRIQWAAGDLVERRPPLSRWRDEYKDEFQKWSRTE